MLEASLDDASHCCSCTRPLICWNKSSLLVGAFVEIEVEFGWLLEPATRVKSTIVDCVVLAFPRYFFCGSFMFLFCLVFAMFCARLFICASWSPAGKGLTSWLSFVVSSVSLSLSHWYPGSGVVLDCIDS